MPEPLTPPLVEAKLRWLSHELDNAETALATMRDLEVDARHELNRERRKAILSPACPRVGRDAHTAAYRDAWVEREVADLIEKHDRAVVARDAAQDHLRVLHDQVAVVRSLGVAVRERFDLAGVGS